MIQPDHLAQVAPDFRWVVINPADHLEAPLRACQPGNAAADRAKAIVNDSYRTEFHHRISFAIQRQAERFQDIGVGGRLTPLEAAPT
jgi:hypothetical protein